MCTDFSLNLNDFRKIFMECPGTFQKAFMKIRLIRTNVRKTADHIHIIPRTLVTIIEEIKHYNYYLIL